MACKDGIIERTSKGKFKCVKKKTSIKKSFLSKRSKSPKRRSKRSKKRSCKYGKSKRKSKSGRKKCLKSKRRSKKRSKRSKKRSMKRSKKRSKRRSPQKRLGNLSDAFCIKNLYDMESKHDFEGYKRVLKTTKGLDFSRSPALKAYHKEMIKQIKKSRSPILKRDPEIYALMRK